MLPFLLMFLALTWFTPFLPPQEPPGYEFGQVWRVAVWSTIGWLAILALLVAIDRKAGRKPHWFLRQIEGPACVFFLPVLALQGLLVAQMAAFWSDAPLLLLFRDMTAWLAEALFASSSGFRNLIEVNDRVVFPQHREMSTGLQAIIYVFTPLAFLASASIWLRSALKRIQDSRPFSKPETILILVSLFLILKFVDSLAASTEEYSWLHFIFNVHILIAYLFTVAHYVTVFDFIFRSIFDLYMRYIIVLASYFFALWLLLIPEKTRRRAAEAEAADTSPSAVRPPDEGHPR